MNEYTVIFLMFITGCESNAFSITFDPKTIISTTSKQYVGVTLDTGLLRVGWDKIDFRYFIFSQGLASNNFSSYMWPPLYYKMPLWYACNFQSAIYYYYPLPPPKKNRKKKNPKKPPKTLFIHNKHFQTFYWAYFNPEPVQDMPISRFYLLFKADMNST